jgi:hypothetical protein
VSDLTLDTSAIGQATSSRPAELRKQELKEQSPENKKEEEEQAAKKKRGRRGHRRPKRRFRSDRPERMNIAGEQMVRNDIVARDEGEAERTLNRRDKDGAPYIYIGGVKYRPIERYHQFILGRIQVRNQPTTKRRTVGRPHR